MVIKESEFIFQLQRKYFFGIFLTMGKKQLFHPKQKKVCFFHIYKKAKFLYFIFEIKKNSASGQDNSVINPIVEAMTDLSN